MSEKEHRAALKPCPFCGSDKTLNEVDDGIFWTLCLGCQATGPVGSRRQDEDSIDWNTRATSPADKDVEARQRFKDYVHKRLDDAGVPTHPEGEHSAHGCRIGDRLDIALQGYRSEGFSISRRQAVNGMLFGIGLGMLLGVLL